MPWPDPGRDVGDLVGKTNYIDYKALGYAGDPIETGGRFDKLGLGLAHAKDRRKTEAQD
jgi:hypothetical protein